MKVVIAFSILVWFTTFVCSQKVELPAPDTLQYGLVYGQEYPRVNPPYCKGFEIEYPIAPGLAFEIGSTQEIHWAVNKSVEFVPNYIYRIRLMNSTQHNHYIIQGASELYSKKEDNKGGVSFPLIVVGSPGTYHYRIIVNHTNQTVHCIYESVPFTLLGNPNKNIIIAGAAYNYTNPGYKYLVAPVQDFGMKYPLGS